jgi:DNA-binding NarL/FixJ family response regulator
VSPVNAAALHILFLEDDPSHAELVERALVRAGIHAVIRVVDSADAFRRALREFAPDLVLSDHSGARFTALHAIGVVRATRPATPVILVSGAFNEMVVVESLKAGAEDYVLKDRLDRLAPAIRVALALRQPLKHLTPRQVEVMQLLVTGLSTRETAGRLGISNKTVETHRAALMRRLGIHHLPGLVQYALRIGMAPLEPEASGRPG